MLPIASEAAVIQHGSNTLFQYGALGVIAVAFLAGTYLLIRWFLRQMEESKKEMREVRDNHEKSIVALVNQSQVVVENNTIATKDNTRAVVDLGTRVTKVEDAIERLKR